MKKRPDLQSLDFRSGRPTPRFDVSAGVPVTAVQFHGGDEEHADTGSDPADGTESEGDGTSGETAEQGQEDLLKSGLIALFEDGEDKGQSEGCQRVVAIEDSGRAVLE